MNLVDCVKLVLNLLRYHLNTSLTCDQVLILEGMAMLFCKGEQFLNHTLSICLSVIFCHLNFLLSDPPPVTVPKRKRWRTCKDESDFLKWLRSIILGYTIADRNGLSTQTWSLEKLYWWTQTSYILQWKLGINEKFHLSKDKYTLFTLLKEPAVVLLYK